MNVEDFGEYFTKFIENVEYVGGNNLHLWKNVEDFTGKMLKNLGKIVENFEDNFEHLGEFDEDLREIVVEDFRY